MAVVLTFMAASLSFFAATLAFMAAKLMLVVARLDPIYGCKGDKDGVRHGAGLVDLGERGAIDLIVLYADLQ
eukprot:931130-Rhodomonas_salina.1